jgi:uncharacterized iron-regulated membrane protein
MIAKLTEISEIFGVSAVTVSEWVAAGMPKMAKNEYDVAACVQWRCARLKEAAEIARNSGDEKLHALKMQGQKIANKANEIKLRRMLGELVDLQAARLAWLNETTIFRKSLNAMVYKLSAALEGEHTKVARLGIIAKEVTEVLNMVGELRIESATAEEIDELTIEDGSDNITE